MDETSKYQVGGFPPDKAVVDLFQRLFALAKEQDFGAKYLSLLDDFCCTAPQSEYGEVFLALALLASGETADAINVLKCAERKRKLSFIVIKLLAKSHRRTGNLPEAIYYNELGRGLYPAAPWDAVDQIASDFTADILDAISLGRSKPGDAPFLYQRVIYEGGKLATRSIPYIGEMMPMRGEAKGNRQPFWIGLYRPEMLFEHYSAFFSRCKNIIEDNYSLLACLDPGYDMRRSALTTEASLAGKPPYVLSLAGVADNQKIKISDESGEYETALPKYFFSYFRFDHTGEAKISSDIPFAVAEPIRLSSQRKKRLVINILADGLSWRQIKRENYRRIPNIMRFFSRGVIFDDCQASAEYTFPALASIESSLHLPHSQIFNENAMAVLGAEHPTISEQMAALGYHCAGLAADSCGIANGALRGFSSLVNMRFSLQSYEAVERAIYHLEAFGEADNYLLLHVTDTHPNNDMWGRPYKIQAGLPLKERTVAPDFSHSINMRNKEMTAASLTYSAEMLDRRLGILFDYILAHYDEDEFVVHLYSDHGTTVFEGDPGRMAAGVTSTALMVRGGGDVPALGVVDELVSSLDLYPIMGKTVGFAPPDDIDGRLPRVFGGPGRRFAISNSIFPGQPFRLSVKTKTEELSIQSFSPVQPDGRVDLQKFSYRELSRDDNSGQASGDKAAFEELFAEARNYTSSFRIDGLDWPAEYDR